MPAQHWSNVENPKLCRKAVSKLCRYLLEGCLETLSLPSGRLSLPSPSRYLLSPPLPLPTKQQNPFSHRTFGSIARDWCSPLVFSPFRNFSTSDCSNFGPCPLLTLRRCQLLPRQTVPDSISGLCLRLWGMFSLHWFPFRSDTSVCAAFRSFLLPSLVELHCNLFARHRIVEHPRSLSRSRRIFQTEVGGDFFCVCVRLRGEIFLSIHFCFGPKPLLLLVSYFYFFVAIESPIPREPHKSCWAALC